MTDKTEDLRKTLEQSFRDFLAHREHTHVPAPPATSDDTKASCKKPALASR